MYSSIGGQTRSPPRWELQVEWPASSSRASSSCIGSPDRLKRRVPFLVDPSRGSTSRTEGRGWEAGPLGEREHVLGRGELASLIAGAGILIELVAVAALLPGEDDPTLVGPSR